MTFTLVVLILIVLTVLVVVSGIAATHTRLDHDSEVTVQPYQLKPLLEPKEAAFFRELQEALPEGFQAFPKVRFADFLYHPSHGYRWFNKVSKHNIDVLICDATFKPIIAIEIQTHVYEGLAHTKSDLYKKEATTVAGLQFIVVAIGTDFQDAIEQIVATLAATQPGKVIG